MKDDADIRALVFDVGQVIVRVEAERTLEALAASAGRGVREVRQVIARDLDAYDLQKGRLTPEQWYKHLRERLGLRLSFEQFLHAWNLCLDPQTILDENLLEHLTTRCRMVLLSNTDPIHVAHMESRFRFPRCFPARIYSCTVGMSKPDPAIYREAIARAGVEAQHILYIDDVPEYVEAGRRAGMLGHHFQGPDALLAELRARKLV